MDIKWGEDHIQLRWLEMFCLHSKIPGTWLLLPIEPQVAGRLCLFIDLDDTLIHSYFKLIGNADLIVPVEIKRVTQQIPGCLSLLFE
ncbi:carboxy-terminal domain RNA polymerase II polypeptide A small phosphatase 2-like isoform X2 [Rhincodon typus]|uniref:carboxy-terminal domain RNA polymerase II polypeptide A small phosphatase 2-like isoform X2 n=1 Tax=Rhincodon typus TaxID=259920 RepID=UPI00202F5AE6|nr:carboxy-terminal domain RNA polymerase II polypeptide A small phosphatase 2-like isoform X2 [Rhincodon typus]